MLLAAKTRVGPYDIIAPLGVGGMGEVYKARDTRLDRIVAIKICTGRFTELFEREARAISSLNTTTSAHFTILAAKILWNSW